VAAVAGVDIATVSRALNRSPGVEVLSAECVRRVEVAARKLRYRPNSHARSMRTGKANAIGVVSAAYPSHPFISAIIEGVHGAALTHGCHCVTIGGEGKEDAVATALRFHAEHRIDGLVVPLRSGRDPALAALDRSGCPAALIDAAPTARLPSAGIDEAVGMRKAVDHLAELGHRRLLYLEYGQPHESFRGERRRVVERRAAELGLELAAWSLAPPTFPIDREIDANRLAILERLAAGLPATGAVCYNDSIALALYAALRDRGLRVPEDLSVVGFDDLYAALAYPPLTTLSHMFGALGNAAVDLLMSQRKGEAVGARMVLVEPDLVVRRSTREM
jgi:DNA-binding LacI/PurR family transcriptional regulator